jgi:hypothetical protein
MYQVTKIFKSTYTYLLVLFTLGGSVFAVDCTDLDMDPPSPATIVCFVGRIINVFLLSAGILLVAVIAWGAIKASLSLGDPKALAGARSTWVYALIGFGVVVGAVAVLIIIGNALGLSISPSALIDRIYDSIGGLLDASGITNWR